jgi:multidrug efflux pump subunit AcrB
LDHQQIRRDSHYLILGQLGKIEKEQVKSQIIKENQEYIQYLDFDFIGPYTIGNSFLKQCLDQARLRMPTGFSVKRQRGMNREMNKQWIVLPLIYLLIFIICASTLESFQQAKKIMLLIWFSYIGIFLGFGSLNLPIDQGIYTAFILVSGLVVNALILLFNEYKRLSSRFSNLSPIKLYIKALRRKINPIILSISTTIFGLLPFIYEGKNTVFWFNLGVGTSFGLVFSLVLISFYTPLNKG